MKKEPLEDWECLDHKNIKVIFLYSGLELRVVTFEVDDYKVYIYTIVNKFLVLKGGKGISPIMDLPLSLTPENFLDKLKLYLTFS